LLEELIDVASGKTKADIVIKNVNLVNVFSGEVYETDIAIKNGRIAGLGEYCGEKEIDGNGKYAVPGLIDGHIHVESSMLTVSQFARAVIPHGTTAIVIDPHEIANVLGVNGIKFLLEEAKQTPLKVFSMVPSCVPATHMETAGAEVTAKDVEELLEYENVLGLGEVMNFPGVINKDSSVLSKIKACTGVIDGHSPGLDGKELNAYKSVGIVSDHECTSAEEAMEKLRLGMKIMIREGSTAKNLRDLVKIVNEKTARNCLLVTDDRHPADLLKEGHVDHVVRESIRFGLDPVLAVQMVTINPAEYFGLKQLGAISPGRVADVVLLEDLEKFEISEVMINGQIVAKSGKILYKPTVYTLAFTNTMNVKPVSAKNFEILASKSMVKVIGLVPSQIITRQLVLNAKIEGGRIVSDVENDVLKVAVVERHKKTGNIGLGFVKGFGLKEGAIASSVAHDSHNIIVIGTNDEDMAFAVNTLVDVGGGMVVVKNKKVLGRLELPVAGLISTKSVEEVSEELNKLHEAAKSLGCRIESPFLAMSFLALPVIPELKITDKGLVDVEKFKIVDVLI
jgi:adenine deaminase